MPRQRRLRLSKSAAGKFLVILYDPSSCCERQSIRIIVNRFARRRLDGAQMRRIVFSFAIDRAARCGLDATCDTSARLYKIDHLGLRVRPKTLGRIAEFSEHEAD